MNHALPIYRYEDAIVAAVRDHRVVVIEGPTGSGKTTQLPRILLRAGLSNGIIGVTQPRRIAAVSVAWRIAEELGVELGEEVGYAIRFDDRTGPATEIKIMTDGILLMEARTDPDFGRYGIIVVDEAHERTLNIDFTLGLLHRALSRRSDLKVVVSSATIQPEVFQRYFEGAVGNVPFVSIDARPYPVDIVYKAPPSEDLDAMMEAAFSEVMALHVKEGPGAILVFLSGEAMIRGVEELLARSPRGRELHVMPLYGKLTRDEQEAVFQSFEPLRKVVLATNIAETSITIPDVRHVIDSGLAKVPRVHVRSGISTLHDERISRASAEQRAGRAGRTAPGTAVRLYSRKSYQSRPAYTDEEILRLDLSEVVLRLIHLGVRDVEAFPLPTRPPPAALRAALDALRAMGAIDVGNALTPIGERMMPFPLSPSLARMVVEAAERFPTVVDEVLMVGAFLSSRPPYLYPQGEESEARAAQEAFADPLGDAVTAVQVLRRYRAARGSAAFCERSYLDPHLMAFIDKAHRQLTDIAVEHGIAVRSGGDPTGIVRSVATGFARQILRSGRGHTYEGPGDMAISIHPSSSLFGRRAQVVVAAEVVISNRPYARFVSMLRPEWVPEANPQLADAWGMGRRKKPEPQRSEPDARPTSLWVGGVELPVTGRRPELVVDVAHAASLGSVNLAELPGWALGAKTRLVQDGRFTWGRGAPLAEVLCLLPHLPLPEGPPEPIRDVPQGALLESDRNLHTLARFVDRVLSPGLPAHGNRPGWLALVSNGETGFWFEVVTDFQDAVLTSLAAVSDLVHALPHGDPLRERVEALQDELAQRSETVEGALRAARRPRERR
ncbi:MAG: hypothetical protein AMXMBFR64_37700 [Myxococcales bacterium]